jgi:hypothetical protein
MSKTHYFDFFTQSVYIADLTAAVEPIRDHSPTSELDIGYLTVASYNASNSLVRSENKAIFPASKIALAGVIHSCTFRNQSYDRELHYHE